MLKFELISLWNMITLTGIESNSLVHNKKTYASSNGYGSTSDRVVDGVSRGDFGSYSCWEAGIEDMNPYWMVDLDGHFIINHVNITNRSDCCADRLHSIQIVLYAANPLLNSKKPPTLCAFFPGPIGAGVTQTIPCEGENATGRFLKINGLKRRSKMDVLTLCEVNVSGIKLPAIASNSLAHGKPAYASSNGYAKSPAQAVDGNFNTNSLPGHTCWDSAVRDKEPYWMVDLEDNYYIHYVNITNRGDCCGERLHSVKIMVYAENPLLKKWIPSSLCAFFPGPVGLGVTQTIHCDERIAPGRFLKVNGLNRTSVFDILHMCEITVSGIEAPVIASNSLAHHKVTYSSSNGHQTSPSQAVDGNFNPNSLTGHTCWESRIGDLYPYWMVDLEDDYFINYINITNKGDCCGHRLHSIEVILLAENPMLNKRTPSTLCAFFPGPVGAGVTQTIPCNGRQAKGRFLRVNGLKRKSKNDVFQMCEITVSGFKVSEFALKAIRDTFYKRLSNLQNARLDRTLAAYSLTHCGVMCRLDEDCCYYKHEVNTGACHLYISSKGDEVACLFHDFCYALTPLHNC